VATTISMLIDDGAHLMVERFKDRKVEPQDVDAELMAIAEAYAYNYDGNFPFMVDMQQTFIARHSLSKGQAKGVLNCLRAQALKRAEREQGPELQAAADARAENYRSQKDGTYTINLGDGGKNVTLKLKTLDPSDEFSSGFSEGTQVAEYMDGSDNEKSFSGFAFVDGEGYRVWRRFWAHGRNDMTARRIDALELLLQFDFEQGTEAREAYALESGRCWRCNRKLTVEFSIHRGLGPECAKKVEAGE
jgi:hypothetical protein